MRLTMSRPAVFQIFPYFALARFRSLAAVFGAVVLTGCASTAAKSGDADGAGQRGSAPAELVIDGARYVRRSALSEAEVAKLKDPQLWQEPQTLDKLAQLLRSYLWHAEYGEYIEAEPNYELAMVSLGQIAVPERGGDGPLPPGAQVVDKSITSDGDGRNPISSGEINLWPNNAYALVESGGTGTMVGWRVYTAGHVLWNNATSGITQGWRCRDGSASNAASPCANPGHPRFRFSGRAIPLSNPQFATAWALCGWKRVPSGWVNMPANTGNTALARWDYALQNLDGCIPAGADSVGWWVAPQATLRVTELWHGGYPQLQPCPALSFGGTADCPAGTPRLAGAPGSAYAAGTLFWSAGGSSDPNLIATGGYLQSSKMDVTPGDSGGAIIGWNNGWFAVATASNTAPGGSNTNYNWMTAEVQAFLYGTQ